METDDEPKPYLIEIGGIDMKWKLFCSVTMQSYEVEASSEYEARKKLANQLNVPLSCIDVFR